MFHSKGQEDELDKVSSPHADRRKDLSTKSLLIPAMILVKSTFFPQNRYPAAFIPAPSLFDAIFVYSTIDRTLEHRSHSSVLGDLILPF